MSYKMFRNLVGSVRRHDRITSIKFETNLELCTRSKLRDIGCEHTLRKDYQSICNYLLHQETAIFGKTTFFSTNCTFKATSRAVYRVYRIPSFCVCLSYILASVRLREMQFFYIFSDWFRIVCAATMTIVVSRCNAKEISNSFVQCT